MALEELRNANKKINMLKSVREVFPEKAQHMEYYGTGIDVLNFINAHNNQIIASINTFT